MKTNRTASGSLSRHRYADRRSSALLIVLGCIVFISVLIVAFFASVTAERQSAQFYANSSSVKLLADSAVNIVMGQIKDATRGTDTSGNILAWASQPGMIRTYNTSAQPSSYYKLYSWANMIGTGAFNPTSSAETPPSNWTNMPALYTDLNEPVSGVYPIVDPSATNTVIGFSITGAPVSTRDAAPMPVQWLYVLQNGTLATATGSGNTATVATATAGNPIVARIAFWTDDDTSKININTAAGDAWTNSSGSGYPSSPGAFWDTPRMNGSYESNYLGLCQPVHGEFQRYPGHPAETYLSAVFPGMTTNNLFAITPRVNGGGSDGGSIAVTTSTGAASALAIPQKTDRLYASVDELMFSTNMTAATNRIQNTNGASAFSNTQVQSASFFLTTHSRAPEVNLYNQPRIETWPVNETNAPNCRTAYDSLIAFCGSLVCTNSGTLNTNAYYFQRANSMNPTNDLPNVTAAAADPNGVGRNRALIQYLQYLTSQPVPGFSTNGETFLSKYPANGANPVNTTATDRDQILTEIFDYIRCLNEQDSSSPATMTNSFTPTTTNSGANTQTQMPLQSGQITPIYDTVNNTRGFGRFPTVIEAGLLFFGIGQTLSPATNYPPYALSTNSAGVSFQYALSNEAPHLTNTWAPASTNYSTTGGTATNAASGMTRVQPALVSNLFDPSMGFASKMQNYWIEYDGLDSFTWTSGGVSYPMFAKSSTTNLIAGISDYYGGYMGMKSVTDYGNGSGIEEAHNVDAYYLNGANQPPEGLAGYPAYGIPLDIFTSGRASQLVNFLGGTLVVKLRAPSTDASYSSTPGPVIQQITIVFPPFSCPTPGLAPYVTDYNFSPHTNPFTADFRNIANRFSRTGYTAKEAWITDRDAFRSMVLNAAVADPRMVAGMTNVPSSYFMPGPYYNIATVTVGGHGMVEGAGHPYLGTYYGNLVPNVAYTTNSSAPGVTNQGTFVSTVANPTFASYTLCGCESNGLTYVGTTNYSQGTNAAWTIGQPWAVGSDQTNGITVGASIPVVFNTNSSYNALGANGVFAGGGTSASAPPGDWDTGDATQPDGAYINKADEGDDTAQINGSNGGGPYFTLPILNNYLVSPNFFSPNRQMPSPGMFGSLPTGIISQKPWQTLLFRPDPGGTPQHIGAQSPKDFLLLDLFNMPVVEPYPISDPFSTAGKINMNYQIVPFTYITRSTAVQAVMRGEQMLAIPTSDGPNYKSLSTTRSRRYFIDLSKTLTGFSNMFTTGTTDGTGTTPDIFRSASQICNIWLVPSIPAGEPGLTQPTYSTSSMQSFWTTAGLTGDNIRERPYANIYGRLTTKSNTFTVHFRVQTLKKIPTTAVTQWVEGTDVITGEYRGSSTMERYLDTSNTAIPDYATAIPPAPTPSSIDNFYKFRVIETKQFTP